MAERDREHLAIDPLETITVAPSELSRSLLVRTRSLVGQPNGERDPLEGHIENAVSIPFVNVGRRLLVRMNTPEGRVNIDAIINDLTSAAALLEPDLKTPDSPRYNEARIVQVIGWQADALRSRPGVGGGVQGVRSVSQSQEVYLGNSPFIRQNGSVQKEAGRP